MLGLKTYYIEKKDVQDWFKSIFCLALLPITSVEQEFELLSIQMTQVVSRNFGTQSRSKGKDFLTYFKNTYLQPRRGLVTQQTQIQFTEIQSLEESETTHLTLKMKGKMKYHPNP